MESQRNAAYIKNIEKTQ